MQSLTIPHGSRNPSGFDAETILAALRGTTGTRQFSFRYELLTAANVKVADLDNIMTCSIEQNWLANIKRTARFGLKSAGQIDFLSQRIKPWIRLHIGSSYVEWPQGVFLLSTPKRAVNADDVVTRDVEGYDALQVFLDDKVENRYTVDAGTVYTTEVSTLLGSIPKNITASTATLSTAKEWEPGTPKLSIINDLLGSLNYDSLSFDEDGVAIVKPYVSPGTRASEYTYADDAVSVIHPEVMQELDLFAVPNKWVLVVSDPDQAAIVSTYTNNDPASPTSTVRRQRTITDFRTEQDAASQNALDQKVARLAFEASQVYEAIEFTTGLMPIHSGNDVYTIRYGPLAVDAKYSEQSWSMSLTAGVPMKHRARRVVLV